MRLSGRQAVSWTATIVSLLALGSGAACASERSAALPPGSVQEYAALSGLYEATRLAVDPEGNIWFNAHTPGSIDRVSPTGTLTGEFVPTSVTGSSVWPAYSEPRSLAIGPDGNVWFTELGTTSEGKSFVDYFTPAGQLTAFQIPTADSRPAGIAFGGDGNMWFAEEGLGKIGRVTGTGTVTEFTIPSSARQEYMQPRALTLGSDGNLWFTDAGLGNDGQNLIGRVTPSGEIMEFSIPAPYDNPDALALGADGSVWFTESPDGVGRITPSGIFSEFAVASVSGSEAGLAEGPDGNMWFSENADAIGRITPAGDVTNFEGVSATELAPTALVDGHEGDLWYVVGSHLVRLSTPRAPASQTLPAIAGQTVEGDTLSASTGAWSHAPSTYGYRWQVCNVDGSGCVDLAGQTEATHVLGAGEVGHTLRIVVTAANVAGSASAASPASAVVQAAPRAAPPVPPTVSPVSEPLAGVASAMTWNFGWARRYTLVDSLVVRSVPAGGVVEVSCRRAGCPFASWRSDAATSGPSCRHGRCKGPRARVVHGTLNLTDLFKNRRLKVGARIVVTITKPGWIGKSFTFTVRADRPPRVQIVCLGAGPSNFGGGC